MRWSWGGGVWANEIKFGGGRCRCMNSRSISHTSQRKRGPKGHHPSLRHNQGPATWPRGVAFFRMPDEDHRDMRRAPFSPSGPSTCRFCRWELTQSQRLTDEGRLGPTQLPSLRPLLQTQRGQWTASPNLHPPWPEAPCRRHLPSLGLQGAEGMVRSHGNQWGRIRHQYGI